MTNCFVCSTHANLDALPGGALFSDEHVVVPRRHLAELRELNPGEAASFGQAVAPPRQAP